MQITETQAQIRDTARRFAAREIAPHAADWDRAAETGQAPLDCCSLTRNCRARTMAAESPAPLRNSQTKRSRSSPGKDVLLQVPIPSRLLAFEGYLNSVGLGHHSLRYRAIDMSS